MKQKIETKPAAVPPQVINKGTDHRACSLMIAVLICLLAASFLFLPKFSRNSLLAAQARERDRQAKEQWINGNFPGYLGEADFSRDVIQPFVLGDIGIKFGLAPDGTVVWRNHDPDKAVAFDMIQSKKWQRDAAAEKLKADRERKLDELIKGSSPFGGIPYPIFTLPTQDDSIVIGEHQTNGTIYLNPNSDLK